MAYVDLNTKWVEHWVSAHKEVIALNKEGFENVKVSTLIAIQICVFKILNSHSRFKTNFLHNNANTFQYFVSLLST